MFESKNLRLFGLGLFLLAVGYVLLGQGPVNNHISKSLAPIILVGVYCIFFPYALLVRGESGKKEEQGNRGV